MYQELSRKEEMTVKTEVKFDFLNEPIIINHFMPQSEDDIQKGIMNRYESEKRAIEEAEQALLNNQ